jgi:pimeloyl-ACP methyl ester carboxylesterase
VSRYHLLHLAIVAAGLGAAMLLICTSGSSLAADHHRGPREGKFTREDFYIETIDKVLIQSSLYSAMNDGVIIYCHRTLGNRSGPEVDRLVEAFIDRYDLITFDFRGHSASYGVTTAGGDEILDLRALIGFAKSRGYRPVVVVGAGMGGSVGLRTAETMGNIDALVVISPSGFSPSVAPFLVRFISDKALATPYGRVPLRIFMRTRVGMKYSAGYPADFMASVDSVPMLIFQAEEDGFVSLKRLRVVFEDLPEEGHLLITPGAKHAEELITPATIERTSAFLDSVFEGVDTEGQQTYPERRSRSYGIDRIVLTGDVPLPRDLMLSEVATGLSAAHGPSIGAVYRRGDILRRVRETLAFHGYTRSALTVVDSLSGLNVRISVPRVRSVSIEGNRWVKAYHIRRVLNLGQDRFNAYELDSALRRAASEPAIRTARSRITERPDGSLDVAVTIVEERPYHFLVTGKCTDIDDFFGFGFTWNEFNPTGFSYSGEVMAGVEAHDVLTQHTLGRNLLGGSLMLAGTYFDVVRSRDDVEYVFTRQEVHEIGGEFTARYGFSSSIAGEVSMSGRRYKPPVVNTGMEVQEGSSGSIAFRLDFNGRLPRHLRPRFEWRHTFYYRNVGPWEIGDFDYEIYQFNLWTGLRLCGYHGLGSEFHIGWINREAPPQEYLSLGGMTTLPGYADDSFVGTRVLLLGQSVDLSAAAIVPETSVWNPLGLRLYFHGGTVWEGREHLKAATMKMDTGFEFGYMDVLRAGIAWPVGPAGEDSPRVYVGWRMHVL